MVSEQKAREVAALLTKEQKQWLLAMQPHTDEQEWDYNTVFDVVPYVEIKPEVRCEQTGLLLVPRQLEWLGALGHVGGRAWRSLSSLGLHVRSIVEQETSDGQ